MKLDWTITDFDRRIWEEELETFVPKRVFDAHVHLWSDRYAGTNQDSASPLRLDVGFAEMDAWSRATFPGRELGYLLLGTPIVGMDLEPYHRFMAQEIKRSPHQLGSTIVTPGMSAEQLDLLIQKYHFTGLKPYRSFAPDPANGRITDFLPESLLEVAEQYHLAVTLHISRFDGIADPINQNDLRDLTRRYPHVRWILAHCARGFNAFTLENSIFMLRDLPNIWYDTSAVCDVRSHYLLFKYEKIERLLFGSDNIAAGGDHGKYITWGKGWQFFRPTAQPHCISEAVMVVYEQLRAQKQAADMAELSRKDLEKVFYDNAAAFFGFSGNNMK